MEKYEKELQKLRELYAKVFTPGFYQKKLSDVSQLDNYDSFRTIPFTYKREIRRAELEGAGV